MRAEESYCRHVYSYGIIFIFIRLDGQQTAHNTQLENAIKHNLN